MFVMDSLLPNQTLGGLDPFYKRGSTENRVAKGKLLKNYLSVSTGRLSRSGNPKFALPHQLATNGLLAIFFFLPAYVRGTVSKLESPPCADDSSLNYLQVILPSWRAKRRITSDACCAPKPDSSTN